ncbi:hypothetical protein SNEBB_002934 [Seison nebaliae]|nr:hypothetical protein SNEBB_002934 [Seison nebaliae]
MNRCHYRWWGLHRLKHEEIPSTTNELKHCHIRKSYAALLDDYYRIVKQSILQRQSLTNGLFDEGNGDNVWKSIMCCVSIWGLRQAYRRISRDDGRSYELGQSTVKCMRGILFKWMQERGRLERFKQSTIAAHALSVESGEKSEKLSSKVFHTFSVSVYLYYLCQMINSGLDLITNRHEVSFIQNLVFYIERTYRIPDYGVWLEGGEGELHASCVAAAKAALETIDGFDLYGRNASATAASSSSLTDERSATSNIYVDIDAQNRNRSTLETLLPRETSSIETDASLLFVLRYPMYAVQTNMNLIDTTIKKAEDRLKGDFGWKRFPHENDDNEYPVFLVLQLIHSFFQCNFNASNIFDSHQSNYPENQLTNNTATASIGELYDLLDKLQKCTFIYHLERTFDDDDESTSEYTHFTTLLPEYYSRKENDYVADETTRHHLQTRNNDLIMSSVGNKCNFQLNSIDVLDEENENEKMKENDDIHSFLWCQAAWLIGQMLLDNVITIRDLDPLNRHIHYTEDEVYLTNRINDMELLNNHQEKKNRKDSIESNNPLISLTINRRIVQPANSFYAPVIQVCAIVDTVRLQQLLSTYGITTQTVEQIEPVQIWPQARLVSLLHQNLGRNEQLELSGRPLRPIGVLGTSKLYRLANETVLCYSLMFETSDFYLSRDLLLLIDQVKSDLSFLTNYWFRQQQRRQSQIANGNLQSQCIQNKPLYCLYLREKDLLSAKAKKYKHCLLNFLQQLKQGIITDDTGRSNKDTRSSTLQDIYSDVSVRFDRLQTLLPACYVEDFTFIMDTSSIRHSRTDSLLFSQSASSSSTYLNKNDGGGGEDDDDILSFISSSSNTQMNDNNNSKRTTDILPHLSATEEEENNLFEKIKCMESWKINVYMEEETNQRLRDRSICLQILLERHGGDYILDSYSINMKLRRLYKEACEKREWRIIRRCSALLRKIVDSLSPSLTMILVRGKQITLGVPQKDEVTIDKPVSPSHLARLLYDIIYPHNVLDVSLQQELLLYMGTLIASAPQLFDSIHNIRLGWITKALTIIDSSVDIYALSPHSLKASIRSLLADEQRHQMTPLQIRQLDGCLYRVPLNFYSSIYRLLQHGETVIEFDQLHQLSSIPLLNQIDSDTEPKFRLSVESALSNASALYAPPYRQLLVELIVIIDVVLSRNRELIPQFNLFNIPLKSLLFSSAQLCFRTYKSILAEHNSKYLSYLQKESLKILQTTDFALCDLIPMNELTCEKIDAHELSNTYLQFFYSIPCRLEQLGSLSFMVKVVFEHYLSQNYHSFQCLQSSFLLQSSFNQSVDDTTCEPSTYSKEIVGKDSIMNSRSPQQSPHQNVTSTFNNLFAFSMPKSNESCIIT